LGGRPPNCRKSRRNRSCHVWAFYLQYITNLEFLLFPLDSMPILVAVQHFTRRASYRSTVLNTLERDIVTTALESSGKANLRYVIKLAFSEWLLGGLQFGHTSHVTKTKLHTSFTRLGDFAFTISRLKQQCCDKKWNMCILGRGLCIPVIVFSQMGFAGRQLLITNIPPAQLQ
jgi:hypothetical protein